MDKTHRVKSDGPTVVTALLLAGIAANILFIAAIHFHVLVP